MPAAVLGEVLLPPLWGSETTTEADGTLKWAHVQVGYSGIDGVPVEIDASNFDDGSAAISRA